MKKKALLLVSTGVLACTVGVTALVVGGANQLDAFAATASPKEYSVTFNESNTSSEVVDVYGDEYIVFTTTTDNGNKVGMMGCYNDEASFTFKGASFGELRLYDYDDVLDGRAYQFSTITGFAISYSSKEPEDPEEPEEVDMNFESMNVHYYGVESGTEYKGLSIARDHGPMFIMMMGSVTISSLTIWYSC